MTERGPIMTIGHYSLDYHIDSGAEGSVYGGTDTNNQTKVAIKKLNLDIEGVKKVLNEYTLLQSAKSAHLVEMLDLVKSKNNIYIVYKKYPTDLESLINRREKIDAHRIERWTAGIAKGLHDLHFYGILHRDLKPGNILLTETDEAIITDFGVSVHSSERKEDLVGTMKYIPPEVLDNGEYSTKGDIFAFGMVLYDLIASQPIDREEVGREVFHFKNCISEKAKDLVRICLKTNPKERPSSGKIAKHPFVQKYINNLLSRRIEFNQIQSATSIRVDAPEDFIQYSIVVDDFSIDKKPNYKEKINFYFDNMSYCAYLENDLVLYLVSKYIKEKMSYIYQEIMDDTEELADDLKICATNIVVETNSNLERQVDVEIHDIQIAVSTMLRFIEKWYKHPENAISKKHLKFFAKVCMSINCHPNHNEKAYSLIRELSTI